MGVWWWWGITFAVIVNVLLVVLQVMTDPQGKSRGFGFVSFEETEAAEKVTPQDIHAHMHTHTHTHTHTYTTQHNTTHTHIHNTTQHNTTQHNTTQHTHTHTHTHSLSLSLTHTHTHTHAHTLTDTHKHVGIYAYTHLCTYVPPLPSHPRTHAHTHTHTHTHKRRGKKPEPCAVCPSHQRHGAERQDDLRGESPEEVGTAGGTEGAFRQVQDGPCQSSAGRQPLCQEPRRDCGRRATLQRVQPIRHHHQCQGEEMGLTGCVLGCNRRVSK